MKCKSCDNELGDGHGGRCGFCGDPNPIEVPPAAHFDQEIAEEMAHEARVAQDEAAAAAKDGDLAAEQEAEERRDSDLAAEAEAEKEAASEDGESEV